MVECKDKSDEEGCRVDKNILLVCIGLGLAMLLILTMLTVASVGVSDTEEGKGNFLSILSKTIELEKLKEMQALIVVSQGTNYQNIVNLGFLQHLKTLLNDEFPLIIKTLKVTTLRTSKL